jgi:hypothetical protein
MARQLSRPKRWEDAASRAVAALEELVEIQAEYQDWYDSMPEGLQTSVTGEMLSEITYHDHDGAQDTATEAEGIGLPQGFGRD